MSLALIIYFAGMVDDLKDLFTVPAFILLAVIVAIYVIWLVSEGEANKTHLVKWIVPVMAVMFFVGVIIPDRQTVLLMAGADKAEELVASPEAKELFSDVQEVIRAQLDQYKKKDDK